MAMLALTECGTSGEAVRKPFKARPMKKSEAGILQSYFYLPFGNGMGAGVYMARSDRNMSLMAFYDHIYKQYDAKTTSKSMLKQKGIVWGVNEEWLTKQYLTSAEYIEGTGIVKVSKELVMNTNLTTTEYYFMPMGSHRRIIVAILEISNRGKDTKVSPAMYVEATMGSKEKMRVEGSAIVECKDGSSVKDAYSMAILPSSLASACYQAGKDFPDEFAYGPVKTEPKNSGPAVNLLGQIGYNDVEIKSGSVVRVMAVIGLAEMTNEKAYLEEMNDLNAQGADKVLQAELDYWTKWHSVEKLSPLMTPEEMRLYRQSTAVLKMGQCREPGKPFGQILASMPPGQWNICWPRDASYSIVALIRSGHLEEAKACLEFFLNAPNGKFNGAEYVGRDYKVSVCRYYGNGDEESDVNTSGPNLEWDDFGLVLWAFCEYYKTTGDKAFYEKYFETVKTLIADVLVSLMTDKGYLKPDSSIWERHWSPEVGVDGKRSYAYSTINAIHSLGYFSQICRDKKDAKLYMEKAQAILKGFQENFIDNGVIISAIENKSKGMNIYLDAAVVEAINFGLVDETVRNTTLSAFESVLKMKKSPGFLRNKDNTWYDNQEWLVIDLRIATAYLQTTNAMRVLELKKWTLDNAKANYYLIPELLEENKQSFEGAIPMCGFGAGAYVIFMHEFVSAVEEGFSKSYILSMNQ